MRILLLGSGSRYDVCKEALEDVNQELVSENPDLIVLANYPKILAKEEYASVKYGAICCHGGRLPQYRGSSVLNWQIINNELQGGVSIIQIDEGIDTGDILGTGVFPIKIDDTIKEVRKKAEQCFQELLPRVVMQIQNGTLKKIKQHDIPVQPCYFHHRRSEDSQIKWDKMTALQVHNLIRASEHPYQAYCRCDDIDNFKEGLIFIRKSKLLEDNFYGISGRVVRNINDGSVVICGDRGLWIDVKLKVGDNLW